MTIHELRAAVKAAHPEARRWDAVVRASGWIDRDGRQRAETEYEAYARVPDYDERTLIGSGPTWELAMADLDAEIRKHCPPDAQDKDCEVKENAR